MKKIAFIFITCYITIININAQSKIDSIKILNRSLLVKLQEIIQNNGSFSQAVFLSEQGYQNKVSQLNYYNEFIKSYTVLVRKYKEQLVLSGYKGADSNNYRLNISIYSILCKFIPLQTDTGMAVSPPFTYNFEDPNGNQDFGSTFVTQLLATHTGNCRSLTYLYKILADEVGAKCWLALAPSHIYVRNYSEQIGWYNTELTSGTFPTDAWIAATGYVNADAIRSGIYMDTLSNQQAIGLCILDLMQGYLKQTNNYTDGFVIECCDWVLRFHPMNAMALLIKAEGLQKCYMASEKNKEDHISSLYYWQMEQIYATLIKLGYREMPPDIYKKWLKNLQLKLNP